MPTNLTNLSKQEQDKLILKGIASNGSFAEYCIAIDPKYQLEWFHAEIAQKLEQGYYDVQNGKDVRIMIFVPPRHGKSDMATQKFPSWALGKDPTIPVMVASYSADLATKFGQDTRDIMNTSKYQTMFDTRLRADAKAKGNWLTEEKGGYVAGGVGGTQTGRGFKIGIIDDPFKNREEADSPVVQESRYRWYQSTFSTREEGNSMIVFILTRWHEADLAGRVLKDMQEAKESGEPHDEWDILEYKAIAVKDEKHRKEGEALWPEKFPLSKLQKKKKTMGSYEFSALYQQTPIDEENRKFKTDWFKYRQIGDILEKDTYNILTIDPRGKNDIKSGNDFIGLTLNLVDSEGKWNLSSSRRKLSGTQLIDLMFSWWSKYNLKKIGIEDNQFTQGLMVSIEQEIEKRGVYLQIELLKHGGKQKELRVESLVPRYEYGGIFHMKKGEENLCADLEEELLMFPKAINDDASDSCAYQTQLTEKPAGDLEEDWGLYNDTYI
jgi:phage terminase large subunit-like protein